MNHKKLREKFLYKNLLALTVFTLNVFELYAITFSYEYTSYTRKQSDFLVNSLYTP